MRPVGGGRLYLAGMSDMSLWLFIIGWLAVNKNLAVAVKLVQFILCLICLLTFSWIIGLVGWTMLVEVLATPLNGMSHNSNCRQCLSPIHEEPYGWELER